MKDELIKDDVPPISGISKVHHCFSTSRGIMIREISCHCVYPLTCDCFAPKKACDIWYSVDLDNEALVQSAAPHLVHRSNAFRVSGETTILYLQTNYFFYC